MLISPENLWRKSALTFTQFHWVSIPIADKLRTRSRAAWAIPTWPDAAAAVRDVVAGNYGDRLTTQQLEEILRATGYGLPPETLNRRVQTFGVVTSTQMQAAAA